MAGEGEWGGGGGGAGRSNKTETQFAAGYTLAEMQCIYVLACRLNQACTPAHICRCSRTYSHSHMYTHTHTHTHTRTHARTHAHPVFYTSTPTHQQGTVGPPEIIHLVTTCTTLILITNLQGCWPRLWPF